jgi:type IV pilus assembly protein PilZ
MPPDGMGAGRYSVLVRLFDLINNTSEDQQLSLLKYLHKGNLTSLVLKLIIDMPHEEQSALLVRLKEMSSEQQPEKTITLDERESLRKACSITVDYQSQDSEHSEHILDIGTGGVFIETTEPISVGQELTLNFTFPDSQETIKVNGEIVWRNPKGIGVKFVDISHQQVDKIKTYIAEKKET